MADRRWVVNSSPLILLGKVEQIKLLSAMAGQIAVLPNVNTLTFLNRKGIMP